MEFETSGDSLISVRFRWEHYKKNHLYFSQFKQARRRVSAIRLDRLPEKRSWLLCIMEPISASEKISQWVKRSFLKIINCIPNGLYKYTLSKLVQEREILGEMDEHYLISTDVNNRILYLPEVGLVAMYAPSKNVRTALQKNGIEAIWDEKLETALPTSLELNHSISAPNLANESTSDFWRRYGRGEGRTLAIIDSGICEKSTEFENRVLATWAVITDDDGNPHKEYGHFTDSVGHGTEVASVAAGRTYGIAPDANLVTIKIPMRKKYDGFYYNTSHLLMGIEMLLEENGPLISKQPAYKLIDTLLIPNGHVANDQTDLAYQAITKCIVALHKSRKIVVVAASGNASQGCAFPSDIEQCFSVGALGRTGERWEHSGRGKSSIGAPLPTAHILGDEIPCQSLDGQVVNITGTSPAAAFVAGIFTVLAKEAEEPQTRWEIVNNAIRNDTDAYGALPILDVAMLI